MFVNLPPPNINDVIGYIGTPDTYVHANGVTSMYTHAYPHSDVGLYGHRTRNFDSLFDYK